MTSVRPSAGCVKKDLPFTHTNKQTLEREGGGGLIIGKEKKDRQMIIVFWLDTAWHGMACA